MNHFARISILLIFGLSFAAKTLATENQPLPGKLVNCEQAWERSHLFPELEDFASANFDLFTIAKSAPGSSEDWKNAVKAIVEKNPEALLRVYPKIAALDQERAARLLLAASDRGASIPQELAPDLEQARKAVKALRAETVTMDGELTERQKKDITHELAMLGIRRSKTDRVFQRVKGRIGLTDDEMTPIIQRKSGDSALVDEARLLLRRYNAAKGDKEKAYDDLLNGLYDLYQLRTYEPIDEKYFTVNGVQQSLYDFVNAETYRQVDLHPTNDFMHVGTLRPHTVQQKEYSKIDAYREMWWNRDGGRYRANGSVRVARNVQVLPDGNQKLISIEVIYKSAKDKFFTPYRFEVAADGKLRSIEGPSARKKILACYVCHRRLYGIVRGGITLPDGDHIMSEDWKLNSLDFIKRKYHKDMQGLLEEMNGK